MRREAEGTSAQGSGAASNPKKKSKRVRTAAVKAFNAPCLHYSAMPREPP